MNLIEHAVMDAQGEATRKQSCRKNDPAMKGYTPPMEVGTRVWCDQNVPGDWIIE